MKTCTKCGETKDLVDFYKDSRKEGAYRSKCRGCLSKKDLTVSLVSSCATCGREFTKKFNRVSTRFCSDSCRWASKVRSKEQQHYFNQRYYAENKPKYFASAAKRRAAKTKATPEWDKDLTDFVAHEAYLLCILRKVATKIDWHVDHIVPLQGDNVCGLHIWNNLQLLPASVNLSKGNKWN